MEKELENLRKSLSEDFKVDLINVEPFSKPILRLQKDGIFVESIITDTVLKSFSQALFTLGRRVGRLQGIKVGKQERSREIKELLYSEDE